MYMSLELFDFYMKKEDIRSYICRTLANDKSIQKTVLLDCCTYLDSIDLSFCIKTHIVHDNQDRYFIIGLGNEDPSVFEYFQRKIMKQIGQFNTEAKVYGLYLDTASLPKKDITS